jgi:hypothetical protein
MDNECSNQMQDLFANPLFKTGFFDFFLKMQQEGIEAARKCWAANAGGFGSAGMFPNALEAYERMADFYVIFGFVPRVKYDELASENKSLAQENKFLRDTIRELQQNLFKKGNAATQKIWQKSIDKQLEVNKEIAKNFFEIFRMLKVGTE